VIFLPGQKSHNNLKIKYQNAKRKEHNNRGHREMIVLKKKKTWADFEL
jgi:hypothetical protein